MNELLTKVRKPTIGARGVGGLARFTAVLILGCIPAGLSAALPSPAEQVVASAPVAPVGPPASSPQLGGDGFAPYPGADGRVTPSVPLPAATAGTCDYETRGDTPHISSAAYEASAHGWWNVRPGSGVCPTYADVTVTLAAFRCDFGSCRWVNISQSRSRIKRGGGSANRTTVRFACVGVTRTGWRSTIDVDLVGVSDPDDVVEEIGNISCSP